MLGERSEVDSIVATRCDSLERRGIFRTRSTDYHVGQESNALAKSEMNIYVNFGPITRQQDRALLAVPC